MSIPAPYLSDSELVNAPTGINWSNIPVKGATAQQQQDERALLIREGTSWVDTRLQLGFEPVVGFTLSATTATETLALVKAGGRRARFLPDGTIRVFARWLPVISLASVSYAPDGVTYSQMAGWQAIIEGRQVLRIVPPSSWTWSFAGFWTNPTYGWLQVSYLAGFPNALLSGAVLANATSLPVTEASGFQPLQAFNLYDGPSQDEVLQVAATWTPTTGPASLPLVSGTAYPHAAGLAVSAMPPNARLATRIYVKEIVRQRGYEAISMVASGRGRTTAAATAMSGKTPAEDADMLLQPLQRTV